MRRGQVGKYLLEILLVIIVLVVTAPLYGGIFKKAQGDIDSLGDCQEGLVRTLAGKDAQCKCFESQKCELKNSGESASAQNFIPGGEDPEAGVENALPFSGERDYYWQYIGKGWGCPPKDQPRNEYACITVPNSQNPYSIQELCHARCEQLVPGDIVIVKESEQGECCIGESKAGPSIGMGEKAHVRYMRRSADKDACTLKITVKSGLSADGSGQKGAAPAEASKEYDCKGEEPAAEITIDTPQAIAAQVYYDKSAFNNGGVIEAIVTGKDGAKTSTFTFGVQAPEEKFCSAKQPTGAAYCANDPVGFMILDNTVGSGTKRSTSEMCLLDSNRQTCHVVAAESTTCTTIVDDHGKVLSGDEQPCSDVTFKPGQFRCAKDQEIDWDVDEKAYLCEIIDTDKCHQKFLGDEGEGWLPWQDKGYDGAFSEYGECDTR
jgi:hypothetical protein